MTVTETETPCCRGQSGPAGQWGGTEPETGPRERSLLRQGAGASPRGKAGLATSGRSPDAGSPSLPHSGPAGWTPPEGRASRGLPEGAGDCHDGRGRGDRQARGARTGMEGPRRRRRRREAEGEAQTTGRRPTAQVRARAGDSAGETPPHAHHNGHGPGPRRRGCWGRDRPAPAVTAGGSRSAESHKTQRPLSRDPAALLRGVHTGTCTRVTA